jgi:Fe-S-cluster containining protein
MDLDLKPYFDKYEALVKAVDAIFAKVQTTYPDLVRCKVKCADCCHALFDLTFIEALYLNDQFKKRFQGQQRTDRLEAANRADRTIHKIKREAYKALESGKDEAQILDLMAEQRVRCPLLNDANQCDLYELRPITCRLYGIPTASAGKGHTCGLSGFNRGESYPTANMDVLFAKLQEISAELVADLKTPYVKLADLLVPLSMALLTDYDDVYLGLAEPEPEPKLERKPKKS